MTKLSIQNQLTDFLLYNSPSGEVKVEVFLHNETLWLNQERISELFGVGVPAISKHLKNIFESGELEEKVVVSILENTTQHGAIEGKTQTVKVKYYNLDCIIAVGYRVNSTKATQFRIWSTNILKEFIIKGFVMDDDRMKNGRYFGEDYFKELLERVKSIRSSERRIYQQITDIFAECSIDYDKNSDISKNFYAMIQNKFHYAIVGMTAAEIIYEKADKNLDFMGLSTWKNAPEGRILQSDVIIAKNYLKENEIKELEGTISGFFDYLERIIKNRVTMKMQDLVESVDNFLNFNEYKILEGNGKISSEKAKQKAINEYIEFNKTQKIISDFDKILKNNINLGSKK